MDTFLFYFTLFLFYAFCGWCIEEVVCSIAAKKIVNRGFLIGPYCPIYGYAALIMILTLQRYREDVVALFVMSMVLCTVLEYLTSFGMEKLFHARWWDYSHKKFNINGRVCLVNSFYFGILGCLLVHFINPFVSSVLSGFSLITLRILGLCLLVIFLLDTVISFIIMFKFKFTTDSIRKDNTEEITEKIKEIIRKKSFLHRRLLNAFPNMQAILKEKKKELERFIGEKESQVKASLDEKQTELKNRVIQEKAKLQNIAKSKKEKI